MTVFVDRNYLFPMLVMMQSYRRHAGPGKRFVVGTFEDVLEKSDIKHIQAFAERLELEIEIHEILQSELHDLGEIDSGLHFGLAAFGRLALERRISEIHNYTDVDVIFTKNATIVLDSIPVSNKVGFVPQAAALALAGIEGDPNNTEFFAGFIAWPQAKSRPLVNLGRGGRLTTAFSQHDQALLNIQLGQQYEKLDPRLCQLDGVDRNVDAILPGIVHFFGNWKPWQSNKNCRLRCQESRCLWNLWFEEEDALLSSDSDPSWIAWVRKLAELSRRTRSKAFRNINLLLTIVSMMPVKRLILKLLSRAIRTRLHLLH